MVGGVFGCCWMIFENIRVFCSFFGSFGDDFWWSVTCKYKPSCTPSTTFNEETVQRNINTNTLNTSIWTQVSSYYLFFFSFSLPFPASPQSNIYIYNIILIPRRYSTATEPLKNHPKYLRPREVKQDDRNPYNRKTN